MKITKMDILVDKLPESCCECVFNETKYCSLKIALNKSNTFVQNNDKNIDKDCPLTEKY